MVIGQILKLLGYRAKPGVFWCLEMPSGIPEATVGQASPIFETPGQGSSQSSSLHGMDI